MDATRLKGKIQSQGLASIPLTQDSLFKLDMSSKSISPSRLLSCQSGIFTPIDEKRNEAELLGKSNFIITESRHRGQCTRKEAKRRKRVEERSGESEGLQIYSFSERADDRFRRPTRHTRLSTSEHFFCSARRRRKRWVSTRSSRRCTLAVNNVVDIYPLYKSGRDVMCGRGMDAFLLWSRRITVSVFKFVTCVLFLALELIELQDNWCRPTRTRLCLIQHYEDTSIDTLAIYMHIYIHTRIHIDTYTEYRRLSRTLFRTWPVWTKFAWFFLLRESLSTNSLHIASNGNREHSFETMIKSRTFIFHLIASGRHRDEIFPRWLDDSQRYRSDRKH